MSSPWAIRLSASVLQDGAYPDFVTGDRLSFALEFWWRRDRRLRPASDATARSRRSTGDGWYDVTGSLQRVPDRRRATTYVLDVGVRAYHLSPYEPLARTADDGWVSGVIGLGVDHGAYLDELAAVPDMPPMVYTWTIDEIVLDETPQMVVERGHPLHTRPDGRPERVRDTMREAWRTVDRTRTGDDDGDYLLRCTLEDDEPVHTTARTGPGSRPGPLA